MSCLWMCRNSCKRRGESCQAPLKHTACLNPLASPSWSHIVHTHIHTHIHVDGDWLNADKCGPWCSSNPDPDKHRHHHTDKISWTDISPALPSLSFALIFIHSALRILHSFYLALGKIQPKSHSAFIKLSFHSPFFLTARFQIWAATPSPGHMRTPLYNSLRMEFCTTPHNIANSFHAQLHFPSPPQPPFLINDKDVSICLVTGLKRWTEQICFWYQINHSWGIIQTIKW